MNVTFKPLQSLVEALPHTVGSRPAILKNAQKQIDTFNTAVSKNEPIKDFWSETAIAGYGKLSALIQQYTYIRSVRHKALTRIARPPKAKLTPEQITIRKYQLQQTVTLAEDKLRLIENSFRRKASDVIQDDIKAARNTYWSQIAAEKRASIAGPNTAGGGRANPSAPGGSSVKLPDTGMTKPEPYKNFRGLQTGRGDD